MDSARHVILHITDPCFLTSMAPFDVGVAGIIHQWIVLATSFSTLQILVS
jgi:hypothetical protein